MTFEGNKRSTFGTSTRGFAKEPFGVTNNGLRKTDTLLHDKPGTNIDESAQIVACSDNSSQVMRGVPSGRGRAALRMSLSASNVLEQDHSCGKFVTHLCSKVSGLLPSGRGRAALRMSPSASQATASIKTDALLHEKHGTKLSMK
jgi:hypothetical protein